MKKLPLFFALFALLLAGCDEDQDGTIDVLEPTILTVSPGAGPTGSHVTISGLNFTASSTVSVGGVAADVATVGRTAIAVKVPEGLTTGKAEIIVTTGGSASDPFPFTVTENAKEPEAITFRVIIENVVTPNDYQATLLHLFGLDVNELVFPYNGQAQNITAGRKCRVVEEILA